MTNFGANWIISCAPSIMLKRGNTSTTNVYGTRSHCLKAAPWGPSATHRLLSHMSHKAIMISSTPLKKLFHCAPSRTSLTRLNTPSNGPENILKASLPSPHKISRNTMIINNFSWTRSSRKIGKTHPWRDQNYRLLSACTKPTNPNHMPNA